MGISFIFCWNQELWLGELKMFIKLLDWSTLEDPIIISIVQQYKQPLRAMCTRLQVGNKIPDIPNMKFIF